MRAWPGNYDGLRLRLSSGWYSIPSYVSADERRRLCGVLVAGIAEIDHVVELDWDALDEAAAKLQLTRALAFVRVPPEIEPDGDALARVRATLGSVRLGLLQYEAPGVWADVAWQEREVKAPLLTWLKRWLRDSAHPFAKLGVADLPIDDIAKLTAEPVELLIGVEKVIDHRLRYRRQGMATDDWNRSVMHVAAERLVRRLELIPAKMLAQTLDLAMSGEEVLVPTVDQRDAVQALARAGLAWYGGNDLLLGPLVRLASEPFVLRRLVELLPASAWSEASKRQVRGALNLFLPPPRAILIAPEPKAAIVPDEVIRLWLQKADLGPQLELFSSPEWRAAIDASHTMLDELFDDQLLDMDFQRGHIHRFDAVDLAWAYHSEGAKARALFRCLGLTRLLGRVRGQARLDVIIDEIDRTLGLVDSSSTLTAALHGLRGDALARQNRYRAALESWSIAEEITFDEVFADRLDVRRSLARMRLDEAASFDENRHLLGTLADPDDIVQGLVGLTEALQSMLSQGRTAGPVNLFWTYDKRAITAIAVSLELGDWTEAINVYKIREVDNPRAQLLRAWIDAALGDLDRAQASFESLLTEATAYGEQLDQAFAHRGLAAVAWLRNQFPSAIASLETALNIERALELPDADLLDLELVGWRVLAGQLALGDYVAKLSELGEPSSPSLRFAVLDSFLRFVASAHAVIQAAAVTDVSVTVHPFVATLEACIPLREHSPWATRACEVVVELAARLAASNLTEDASKLLDVVRQFAGDDQQLLASVDRARSHLPPDSTTEVSDAGAPDPRAPHE